MTDENPDDLLRRENARLRGELEAASNGRNARIGRAVHDLRNPLNAFATSLALLEALLPAPQASVRRTLDGMEASLREMERLIEDLQAADRR